MDCDGGLGGPQCEAGRCKKGHSKKGIMEIDSRGDSGSPEVVKTGIEIDRLVAEGKLVPVSSSQDARMKRESHFGYGQDRVRMILEDVASDAETEARAPGAGAVLEELAETVWEFIDDLDAEIIGEASGRGSQERLVDLAQRLTNVVRTAWAETGQERTLDLTEGSAE